MASLPARVALEQRLGLATGLGHAEEQVLGRDELVAQPAGLGLGPLDDGLGARIERQRATLDPGALGEDRRDLAAERGQVDAEPAQRLGRDAVIGLDEGADSRCSASRTGLWSRSAVAWAAMTASWAFWVNRSSCIVGLFRVSCGCRSAGVGLLDEVEEGAAAAFASSDRSVGRTTRALAYRSPWPSPLEARHALPGQPERAPGLGARPGPSAGPCP